MLVAGDEAVVNVDYACISVNVSEDVRLHDVLKESCCLLDAHGYSIPLEESLVADKCSDGLRFLVELALPVASCEVNTRIDSLLGSPGDEILNVRDGAWVFCEFGVYAREICVDFGVGSG